MLNMNRAAILLLSAVLATGASASGFKGASVDYGTVVPDGAVDRTITLKPDAKHLNVSNGETVKVSVGDKSFNWHVSTFPVQTVFDLSKIAPQGIQADGVTVYVAPNPIYDGA